MKTTLLAVAAAAALATGCATHQETGMLVGGVIGAAVGGPIGGVAVAHIVGGVVGAAVGATIGGAIGKHMDDNDHKIAMQAVETNKQTTWTNSQSATTYTVTPKDNGNGTSTVQTDMTQGGKTTTETTTVKKHIKE